jgi:hypothetical protein
MTNLVREFLHLGDIASPTALWKINVLQIPQSHQGHKEYGPIPNVAHDPEHFTHLVSSRFFVTFVPAM